MHRTMNRSTIIISAAYITAAVLRRMLHDHCMSIFLCYVWWPQMIIIAVVAWVIYACFRCWSHTTMPMMMNIMRDGYTNWSRYKHNIRVWGCERLLVSTSGCWSKSSLSYNSILGISFIDSSNTILNLQKLKQSTLLIATMLNIVISWLKSQR